MKKHILVLFLLVFGLGRSANSQEIYQYLFKQFNESENLYVINEKGYEIELTSTGGEKFSFISLVKKYFPEKNIVITTEEEYNNLKGKADFFHISISNISTYRYGTASQLGNKDYDGIFIKQGKYNGSINKRNSLYFYVLNLTEIFKGILPERLEYGMSNLAYITKTYKTGFRSSYYYKVEDYKEYLKTHTLYLLKSQLNEENAKNPASIKKLYNYNFKIVSDEELMDAIKTKKDKVIYLEPLGGAYSRAVYLQTTKGKLLVTTYGWIPPITLSKRSFKVLFEKE